MNVPFKMLSRKIVVFVTISIGFSVIKRGGVESRKGQKKELKEKKGRGEVKVGLFLA